MELTARPATLWDTARLEGQNVIINLAAHQLPEKLVIIPADVWTRLWGNDAHAVNRAHANRAAIEKAINRGWNDDRCKEIMRVGHAGHIMQLWLDDADFG